MRETPPQNLIDQLQKLQLASDQQVRGMYGRVRRLARDLPLFESVWVDALAQARILTPFQASQLNAGRGDTLRVGPYLLCQSLTAPGYVTSYLAREVKSRQLVRLSVAEVPADQASETARRLEALAARSRMLGGERLAPVLRAGVDGTRVWASSRHVAGRTAGQWIAHNGRFPPHTVLEIARQMLAGLVLVEKAGCCHGDLSAWNLILTDFGQVVLPEPGLRGIVRPEEGYAHADLLPEAFDYLAPERVADGTPPTTASDIYACGCVWWHLLAGRPPLPGGSSLAKLRAVQAGEILDVRRLAPDTPQALAKAVAACLERDPSGRPESMARLAALLGEPGPKGRRHLAQSILRPGPRRARWNASRLALHSAKPTSLWLAASAACLLVVLGLAWAMWPRGGTVVPGKNLAGARGEKDGAMDKRTVTSPLAKSQGTGSVRARPASTPKAPVVTTTDVVLPADRPITLDAIPLRAGQCVRGEPGKRPVVVVPAQGLVVREENLRFENLDFVWNSDASAAGPSTSSPAIVRLHASRAAFHGCSFQAVGKAVPAPVAIGWVHPSGQAVSEVALPSGQIHLSDCVFRQVGVGIGCQTIGAVAVGMTNLLHLGTGPLVLLDHCPKLDEPVVVGLSAVTLRDSGPLLECVYDHLEDQPGTITIQANGSAFVTAPQTALLSLVGPKAPEPLLSNIQWTGQGSLVAPKTIVAQWRRPDGKTQVLDDSAVSIAGLVQSAVEFAGSADASPAANRITRWQVPLQSPNPPGVDPASLVWKSVERGPGAQERVQGSGERVQGSGFRVQKREGSAR
jgi:serine/threonine protein kinase